MVTEQAIREALAKVEDPELKNNIVDLQMVKGIRIEAGETISAEECTASASSARLPEKTPKKYFMPATPILTGKDCRAKRSPGSMPILTNFPDNLNLL